MNNLVLFKGYHQESRYERFRRLQVYSGARASIPFHGFDLTAGGAKRALKGRRYALRVDGVDAAFVEVAAGTSDGAFDVDLTGIEPGWHRLDITGLTGGETCPSWFAFFRRGAVGEQPYTPVVRGTYELVQRGDAMHAWALAPGKFNPTPRPLARREYPSFSNVLPRSEMNCMHLVPLRLGDVHRPNVNQSGVLSSFDTQAYFWHGLVAKMPSVALLDGPRGVGTMVMTTHVEIGKAAPDGRPRNNLYVCDPWRVCKVSEDGTIKTLVGYRHRDIPSYWQDPAQVELVGDWSAVPADRRGFHELWGMAWDERTLAINEAAAPIPSENNDRPHVTGAVMFVADSQNDRICKVEFSATSHATAPKVTELVRHSADAWDVVYYEGEIFVTERKAHRIAAYDARTGAYLRTIVQGKALATVAVNRFVARAASLPTLQAEPCVAPEGLYKLPDDPWLYYGSFAQAQVRRVHLETNEVQIVCNVPTNSNSMFFKIAVGDGSFGPRGTVFVWSWQNGQFGLPYTFLPPGHTFRSWSGDIQEWKWYEAKGGAGPWGSHAYATAGAVGQGRLVCGGVDEGLLVISRRQPGDQDSTEAVARGGREYTSRALHLLHGYNGFGFYGLPLPWGISADLDAFLAFHGHRRT